MLCDAAAVDFGLYVRLGQLVTHRYLVGRASGSQ